jgi:hypothetical protein
VIDILADMEHQFAYPIVNEIRRVRATAVTNAEPRWASQRKLVQASLLRCPPTGGSGRARPEVRR